MVALTPAPATAGGALDRLLRLDRRRRLGEALRGSWEDRWAYSLGRVLVKPQTEALVYGGALFDAYAAAQQARRHFARLERLAAKEALR